jgi:hypothetical protein
LEERARTERAGEEAAATAAAVDHLRDALRALVEAAEASLGARCPHRLADDVCVYPATCRNQLPIAASGAGLRCAGDDALAWEAEAPGNRR